MASSLGLSIPRVSLMFVNTPVVVSSQHVGSPWADVGTQPGGEKGGRAIFTAKKRAAVAIHRRTD
jgi:hypothetical protein